MSVSRVFVGRDRELAELTSAVDRAGSGRGGVFVVWGEAGIGKSRLGEELAARAERKARVVWGRCSDDPGSPPFWPWTQVLRGLLPRQGSHPLTAFVDPQPDGESPDESARFRAFDAVAEVLAHAASRRPVLLLLDDLQFADIGSMRLLEFVAKVLPGHAIVIVALAREPDVTPSSERAERLRALGRLGVSIPLRGLSRGDLEELVSARFGLEAPGEVIASLWRLTEGNPFFADEIVRLFLASPDPAAGAHLAMPDGVRDVILRRLAPLTPSTRVLLRFASVAGYRFEPAVVGLAAGQDGDLVQAALREASDHRVAEPSPDAPGWTFSHALVREALYGELSPDERSRTHLALADAIEEVDPDAGPHRAGELARHYLEARERVRAEVLVDRLAQAGAAALFRLAFEEAAEHYTAALEVLDGTADPDDRTRATLLCAVGESRRRAGSFYAAMDAFESAAAAARGVGSDAALVRAAVGFEDARWRAGDFTRLATSSRLLDEALERVGDDVQRAEVLSRRPLVLQFLGSRLDPMIECADEAVAIAERLGDHRLLLRALEGWRAARWTPEYAEARFDMTERFLATARSAGDREAALLGAIFRFCDSLVLGRSNLLEYQALAVDDAARSARVPWLEWWPPAVRGTLALMRGAFQEAGEHASAAAAAIPSCEDQLGRGAVALLLAVCGWETGDGGLVRSSIDTMVEMLPVRQLRSTFNAFADMACGREAEAARSFEEVASGGFAGLVRGPTRRASLMAMLATVCARLGDADRARVIYEAFATLPRGVVVIVPLPALLTTPHWLGVLAATAGRIEDARRHLEDAIAFHEGLSAPAWVARSRLEYGKVLVASDRSVGGREQLESAAQLASTLGMTAVSGEAEALLAGRGPSAPKSDSVFRFEGGVWQLTFAGRTVRLPDLKGLGYLAVLVARPSEEVHVLRLVALAAGTEPGPRPPATADGLFPDAGGSGDTLDAAAVSSYRRRLDELGVEAAEAHASGDLLRATRAREEADWVARELSRSLGLRGDRRPGTPVERTRVNVQRAIRTAIDRLAPAHPKLASHLLDTVRTGTFCVYMADPRSAPRWVV